MTEIDRSNGYKGHPKNNHGVKRLKEVTIQAKLIGWDNIPVEPEKVKKLAAMGCKNSEIANFFGIDPELLPINFKKELILGREEMKQALRLSMLKNAVENNVSQVQIFLAKNLLGMSDNPINTDEKKPLPWSSDEE